MSEEVINQEQKPAETAEEPKAAEKDWKKLFYESQARGEKWKAQLADKEAEDARRAEEAELADLKKKQNIEAIEEKYKTKMSEMEASHARELMARDLRDEFRKAGCNDEFFMDAQIAKYDSEKTPPEYVSALAENEAYKDRYFGTPQAASTGQPAPTHGDPAIRTAQTNWAQVKADLRDPTKAVEADKKVQEYLIANKAMPPGF